MEFIRTFTLFVFTAVAEILGCWLVWSWMRNGGAALWLLPAALCLALFAWLLTLHPFVAGRVYAAYGGVYVATALVWMWMAEGVRPTASDLVGAGIALIGMAVIVLGALRAT